MVIVTRVHLKLLLTVQREELLDALNLITHCVTDYQSSHTEFYFICWEQSILFRVCRKWYIIKNKTKNSHCWENWETFWQYQQAKVTSVRPISTQNWKQNITENCRYFSYSNKGILKLHLNWDSICKTCYRVTILWILQILSSYNHKLLYFCDRQSQGTSSNHFSSPYCPRWANWQMKEK